MSRQSSASKSTSSHSETLDRPLESTHRAALHFAAVLCYATLKSTAKYFIGFCNSWQAVAKGSLVCIIVSCSTELGCNILQFTAKYSTVQYLHFKVQHWKVLHSILQLLTGGCKGRCPLSFTCLNQRRGKDYFSRLRKNILCSILRHSARNLLRLGLSCERLSTARSKTNKPFLWMDKGYSGAALKMEHLRLASCQNKQLKTGLSTTTKRQDVRPTPDTIAR